MGLFKRAAVRGVAHELVRSGFASFPSKEAMDEAADAVADAQPQMPETSPEGGHSPEELAAVANKLIEIAHALMEQAGAAGGPPPEGEMPGGEGGGEPPPPPSPEAAKAAADLTKMASSANYEDLAAAEAVACMDKAASEVKAASGLIHGGDKGNDPAQAAQVGEVAKLDKEQRPEGAYHHGQGKTEFDTKGAIQGDMSKNPAAPKNTPSGSNSLTEDAGAKKASLDEELKKIASKLVGLHDGKDKNKLTDAAKNNEVAKLDNKQRPQGTYLVGQGNANFSEPQTHRIGHEEPHPARPKNSPSGTNSVVEASKTSEEDAFLVLFKKTAEDVGPFLPKVLTEDEKVAAITRMIGYDHDARQEYLNVLHGEKKAAEKPVEKQATYTKKEEKVAEEPQKKESALLAHIREIANLASAT